MNKRTFDCFVLYFIKSTSEILKKLYQWLDFTILSWVTSRKLNLSDGFDSFRLLKFDWLKQYTLILLVNLLRSWLIKYVRKSLQCLKLISTSWMLSRHVGQVCRMDVFHYYIWRSSYIPLAKLFNWRQYGDFISLCFIWFHVTTCGLNKVEKKTSVRQILRCCLS